MPASERVNHTLLAINYGAILALALPLLIGWTGEHTAVRFVTHGVWSALMALAAVGATIFALRDWLAARRRGPLAAPPEDLVSALTARQTVLVTGATGFIGSRLVQALTVAGHQVIVLTRNPANAVALNPPFRLITGLSQLPDDTAIDVIINLAGEPIANGLWTVAKRHAILASRLRMTGNIVRLIKRLHKKPAVLINASAVGASRWNMFWECSPWTIPSRRFSKGIRGLHGKTSWRVLPMPVKSLGTSAWNHFWSEARHETTSRLLRLGQP